MIGTGLASKPLHIVVSNNHHHVRYVSRGTWIVHGRADAIVAE